MKKIVIVDYGLGNLFSIRQALQSAGAEVLISSELSDLLSSDGVLLPGVGAFGDAMGRLKQLGLVDALKKCAAEGKPILGVCLGLQLLFDKSYEFGEHQGLGLIPGDVVRFPESHNGLDLNVPFIGWNNLKITEAGKSKDSILASFSNEISLSFVHSYYVVPADEASVLAHCSYHSFDFPAVVRYKNVLGIQGHPEKSSSQGLELYKNWINSL